MDATVKFPTSVSSHGINNTTTKRLSLRYSSIKTPCKLNLHKLKEQQHRGMCLRRNVLQKSRDRNTISAITSTGDLNNGIGNSFSPEETVEQFYTCINEKKTKELGQFISKNTCFDDYAFTKPFKGKEVKQFLEQLTNSMGKNVKFKVKQIYRGDDFTAAANWHLEWKEKQIPFTRGCSFFQLSEEGQSMIIWKAEVFNESPIKPGFLVLTLLKTVTSIFDDFPHATEWFLRSPHTILKWMLKIYNIFVAPFLNPLVDSYMRLWRLMARMLSYAFSFVILIFKIFIK